MHPSQNKKDGVKWGERGECGGFERVEAEQSKDTHRRPTSQKPP
jgi:hypothetical protein